MQKKTHGTSTALGRTRRHFSRNFVYNDSLPGSTKKEDKIKPINIYIYNHLFHSLMGDGENDKIFKCHILDV